MSDKTFSTPTVEGKQSTDRSLHTFERVRWVQEGDIAFPIIELCFMDSCFVNPTLPKSFKNSTVSQWKWCPNFDAARVGNSLKLHANTLKPWKCLLEHFVPAVELPETPFSRPPTPVPEIQIVVHGQDEIGKLGAGASKGDGPGKRPLKAVTPKSILKHYGKKALEQQPEVKAFKKAFHKSRKEVDKIHVAPVLDQLGHVAIDVVDDVIQTILPVVKEQKYVVPELVDHLPDPQSTIGMLGAGAGKGDGPPKRQTRKSAKGKSAKGKKARRRSQKNNSKPKPKPLKFRTTGKGAVKSGPRQGETWERMVSNEYMTQASIDGANGAGVEVFNNGLLMNPHEILTPEMQLEVQRWEGFTIRPVVMFDAVPTSVLDGSLIGYFDPDPVDTLPTDAATRFQIAESHGAGRPRPLQKTGEWSPNSKRVPFLQSKFWYCDVGGNTNADMRQSYQYRFRCLVYRPPKMYNTAGVEAPVVATVNFRFKYEITFYNRTLDQVQTNVYGNAYAMSLDASTSPHFSTTARIGVVGHESDYKALLASKGKYLVFNDGSNDAIYRLNDGGKMPKHVCLSLYAEATTLTGTPSMATPGNLSVSGAIGPHVVTGGNASSMFYRTTVVDQRLSVQFTTSAAGTLITNGIVSVAPAGDYRYGWYMVLTNYASCVAPADFHVEVIEFDEPLSERVYKTLGPATVEYKLYPEWSKTRHMPFQEYVAQHLSQRGETKEDVRVLRDRVRELELIEPKSPTPSLRAQREPIESKDDAKADWVLMRNRKSSSMK